jgi:hypothetical protein
MFSFNAPQDLKAPQGGMFNPMMFAPGGGQASGQGAPPANASSAGFSPADIAKLFHSPTPENQPGGFTSNLDTVMTGLPGSATQAPAPMTATAQSPSFMHYIASLFGG